MNCNNCGNDRARIWKKGNGWEMCDRCGANPTGIPDVYFKSPYWDENISSEEHPGPKFITSRKEKKYWLEKCNLRESGDRVHGAISFDPISHRHAMQSLRRSK